MCEDHPGPLDNKRIDCGRCGRVWTSARPLKSLACITCGRKHHDELETSATEHTRVALKGGAVVWSGPLGDDRFYLVSWPDGRMSISVK